MRQRRYYPESCIDCGVIRKHATATRGFLSPRCRSCAIKQRWKRDGNPDLTCVRCGKAFRFNQSGSKPHKYCSKACRARRVIKTCPKCLIDFSVPTSNAPRYNYCSLTCAREPAVYRKCNTCSRTMRLTSTVARDGGRFCSFACYRKFTGETSIERRTRKTLESLGLNPIPEFTIAKRLVFDFYVPAHNLLIECDGLYWHSLPGVKDRDIRKNKRARELGYEVIRLNENLIKNKDFTRTLSGILVGDKNVEAFA